jgi:hypothetical protein
MSGVRSRRSTCAPLSPVRESRRVRAMLMYVAQWRSVRRPPSRIEGDAHADCDSDQDRDQKGASLEPGELSQLCLELRVGAAQRRAQVVKVSHRPTQPVAGKGGRVADHCDLNELEPERHALPERIAVQARPLDPSHQIGVDQEDGEPESSDQKSNPYGRERNAVEEEDGAREARMPFRLRIHHALTLSHQVTANRIGGLGHDVGEPTSSWPLPCGILQLLHYRTQRAPPVSLVLGRFLLMSPERRN